MCWLRGNRHHGERADELLVQMVWWCGVWVVGGVGGGGRRGGRRLTLTERRMSARVTQSFSTQPASHTHQLASDKSTFATVPHFILSPAF